MKIYFYSWDKLDINEENFLIFNDVDSRNTYLEDYLVYSVELNQFLLNDAHNFAKAIDFGDSGADINTINYIRVEDENHLPVHRYYYVDRVLQKTAYTYNFEFHIDLVSTYEHIVKDFTIVNSFVEQINLQNTSNVASSVITKAQKQNNYEITSLYDEDNNVIGDSLGQLDGSFIIYYTTENSTIIETMIIPCLYYVKTSDEYYGTRTQGSLTFFKRLCDILITNTIFDKTISIVKMIYNPVLNYENFGSVNFDSSVIITDDLSSTYQLVYTDSDSNLYYITSLSLWYTLAIEKELELTSFTMNKTNDYILNFGGVFIPLENTAINQTISLYSSVTKETSRIYIKYISNDGYIDVTSFFEVNLATSEYEQYRAYNQAQYNVSMDALKRDSSIGGILFNNALPLASNFVGGIAGGASKGGTAGAVAGGFSGLSGLISGTWNASDALCNRWAQIGDLKRRPTVIGYRENIGATMFYSGFSIKVYNYSNQSEMYEYNRNYGFAVYLSYSENPFEIKEDTNFLFYKFSKIQFIGAYNTEIMAQLTNKLLSGIRLWYSSENYLEDGITAFESDNLE